MPPRPRKNELEIQFDFWEDTIPHMRSSIDAMLHKSKYRVRDGYPSASMGGGGGSGEISNPTANTAIADEAHDPTGAMLLEYFMGVRQVHETMQRLDTLRNRIMAPEESRGLRVSSITECKACQQPVSGVENDRIKGAGYCHKCYAAFVRYRDNLPTTALVDHAAFEKGRREYLASKSEQVAS